MSSAVAAAVTMESDLDAFLLSRQATCGANTIATYGYYLRPFVAWLEGRPLSAVSIGAYRIARKAAKVKDATLANDHRMIKTFCRYLVEAGRLEADPFTGPGRVRPLPKKRTRRRVYTDSDIVKLLTATYVRAANKRRPELKRKRWSSSGPYARESKQARALVLLLCDSALRAEEVAKLTCGQLRSSEFIVQSKGGHEDVAFISSTTRTALLELAADRADSAPLFRDWRGHACTTRAIRSILARLAKRAGVKLPPRPLHAFRHFAARQWVKAKVPDLAIRQLMRHSSLTTTRIYTELDAAELAELHKDAGVLDRLVEQAKKDAEPRPSERAVTTRQTRRLRAAARSHKRTNCKG